MSRREVKTGFSIVNQVVNERLSKLDVDKMYTNSFANNKQRNEMTDLQLKFLKFKK